MIRVERWKGILGAALATLLAIGVAAGIAVTLSRQSAQESRSDLGAALSLGACNRGNVVRAYLWRGAMENEDRPVQRLARARAVFPILDCDATAEAGAPVPLPPVAQMGYVNRTIPPLKPALPAQP